MKYLKPSILASLVALSPMTYADSELPNFELIVGGGVAKTEPAFNIDLSVNIPISQRLSSQVNLNSDYIFGDTVYKDYSMSELNALGFYRKDDWRIGAGLGFIEKKSRNDSFATERVGIGHLLAAYYWDEVTLDWQFADYHEEFDRAVSSELGLLWYPDMSRRVGLYLEKQERGNGWRLESYIQPQKFHQQLAIGAIIRNGKGDAFPYLGLEMRYYFDRALTIKDRDRTFH